MKLVTYITPNGTHRAGIATNGTVVDLAEGAAALGLDLPTSVVSLLGLGDAGLESARRVADAANNGRIAGNPEGEVRLT
ncbi:MAG TPA: hypothetical protein VKB09_04420, partial [Thermomicrobiales bacterium]|nr:hypothetical protein [Thermomicrobiales bacterium]